MKVFIVRAAVGFIEQDVHFPSFYVNTQGICTNNRLHKMANDKSTKEIPPRVDDALTKAARVSRGGDRGGRSGQGRYDERSSPLDFSNSNGVGPGQFW